MGIPDHIESSALKRLVGLQLDVWPEHLDFLEKSFADVSSDGGTAEGIASLILRLISDRLAEACRDYRWTCERLLEEELHFRRTGRYRLSSFAEAQREVYADESFMDRYLNGLLLSQVFWSNHRNVLDFYVSGFLDGNADAFDHLEIGPGHGLYLYYVARDRRCVSATGWDISPAGVRATLVSLERLAMGDRVRVERGDIVKRPEAAEAFDSIVVSEVLEHLEAPDAALGNVRRLLRPGGRLFVNMPVNSPAPDHIHLLRAPEEVVSLVAAAGFDVVEARFFPATGMTEARARKLATTISCAVIATRRA
ncbi:MAG: class I SAM-dependent methyltransferase [Rhodospirillales bacterium]|jgi:SAM-dependent methyltransferase|nr:class I SAM-dependent methyltransferase [Rhodospirillales bacterium]